jgi:methyl-accepting chemotaxis protein
VKLSRKYVPLLVIPPLATLLPLAIAFLIASLQVRQWRLLAIVPLLVYALGGMFAWFALQRTVRAVDAAIGARSGVGEAITRCLNRTTAVAFFLWAGTGAVLALTASSIVMPTFKGMQCFGVAAMIVAVPAMAWSYWCGKSMLLGAASDVGALTYHGRTYSIGIKIAMVFLGFFATSAGAIVHLASADHALVVAIVTTIAFAFATYFLARDVTAPIRTLIRVAGDLAEGRFDSDPHVFSDDEVGKLARSFAVTHGNLRGLISSVGRSGGAISEGVRLMSTGTESLVTGAREQSGSVEASDGALIEVRGAAQSVQQAVDKVAELTEDSAARATELQASSGEVARRMDDLFQSVEKSTSGTTEIDAAAREMTDRTTTLSGIAADVLSFVAEMDATTTQIHHTASDSASLSQQVRENAAAGRIAVRETMDGIRDAQSSTRRTTDAFEALQKSLGQIDQILLFIDEVTNRTNLLSFNAAIIAAQAGQNDFGFSVIADEVRQLADRTRSATKEIATIIRGVQPIAKEAVGALSEGVERVDHTVALAHHAAEALETILGSADRSLDMAQSMSSALEEQSRATRHLHGVTATMSDNIREIDRGTRGQAEATRLLSREAERVRDIALQVKGATREQLASAGGINQAMNEIAAGIALIHERMERQIAQTEHVAGASKVTLAIAHRNDQIANQFSGALLALVESGRTFDTEVARFRM